MKEVYKKIEFACYWSSFLSSHSLMYLAHALHIHTHQRTHTCAHTRTHVRMVILGEVGPIPNVEKIVGTLN